MVTLSANALLALVPEPVGKSNQEGRKRGKQEEEVKVGTAKDSESYLQSMYRLLSSIGGGSARHASCL